MGNARLLEVNKVSTQEPVRFYEVTELIPKVFIPWIHIEASLWQNPTHGQEKKPGWVEVNEVSLQ